MLNQNIKKLKPSATLAINERSAALMAQGKKVYRLGFGQSPFPVPEEVVEALRQNAGCKDYLAVRGLLELREAVAHFNRRKLNIDCDANDIMIGPGSKELIYDLLLATDADLLLPSPSWVSYEPQALLANKTVHWIETKEEDNWQLLATNLEEACQINLNRRKILILNYPNNPTGASYSSTELKALASVAKANNILVVTDEIYGELNYKGEHISLASYYPEGTIISSGLSKWCGAGGWRIGTFTFPKEYQWLLKAMAVIASETFTSVSAPIQWASIKAFEGSPDIDRYVIDARKILLAISTYVYNRLRALNINMPMAQGGFYLFPNFEYFRQRFSNEGLTTSTELCDKILTETGVALLPGEAFGRPATEWTARLSFVDFDGGHCLQLLQNQPNLKLDDAFIGEHCPNIAAAMDALSEWVEIG